MDERAKQLEVELSALIGRHAAWLDGPTFLRAAERIAQGHFSDLGGLELINGPELLAAIESALAEVEPELAAIDGRCTATEARLAALASQAPP